MKYLLFALLLVPYCVSAQLKINEIMSNNVSAVMDETYNYSMWVELYNSGTTQLSQANFYFTDNKSEPKKWRPSAKTIAAKGYAVLWFERDEYSGHANFKLEPEGGTLFLMDLSGNVADSVTYPKQYRNISYGRKTDGANEWGYFINHSQGASNNNKKVTNTRCQNPVYALPNGFYSGTQTISFDDPAPGDTIYYSRNGAEPTRSNSRYTPGQKITVSTTTVFRARCFSGDKLPSDVASATYFINMRNYNLPVVSIITEQANLTDNTIGIYVRGTNGITGNGESSPANWNRDWDRPANFELFDKEKKARLNQELDIAVAGGWSRSSAQKSLKIAPRKKFGDNRLRYDFFPESKPDSKYKDIQLRNSGNDWSNTMMRDGFMQSLIINRTEIDYLAYQPAVLFMNGTYYGIQNIRERSSKDYLYTNYGLDEEDFHLIECTAKLDETSTNEEFRKLTTYVNNNDITQPAVYEEVTKMMDVNNFADYFLSQIYYDNTDWPHNNMKMWKKKENGKWRWILYDTDFGFSNSNNNTLSHVINSGANPAALFRRLMLNETFRNKFIDRFCIHLSSTFETNRVNLIMDSIAANIATEITYHKSKWGHSQNFNSQISQMKAFSAARPDKILGFLGTQYLKTAITPTIQISSNIHKASYKFNSEEIIDNEISLKSYSGRAVKIEPNAVPGYQFKHWEIEESSNMETLLPMGETWKYYDGNARPASDWMQKAFSDASWKSGTAPLGYGPLGHKTTISYGSDANNKYSTAYFRKEVTITGLDAKDDFTAVVYVDDGAAVYVNGTEIGRYNLPTGTLLYSTYANTYINGETASFDIPKNLLNEGANLIAIEVHQCNATSSDLIIDMSILYSKKNTSNSKTQEEPVFSSTLTGNIKLKAIYDENSIEDPNKNAVVLFNEIVASNNKIEDEFGEKDDYIELYNPGDENVNIAGWYLTDTPSNLTLVQIPTSDSTKTVIPAKGRLIIWADSQPVQGVLHVGFNLSKDGETIILSRTNPYEQLVEMDKVSFPALEQNMSYSRMPDGSDNWKIQPPTFNAPNYAIDKEPGAITINEIVAANTLIVDEYSEKDDYIELYNADDEDVNIAGWYLSDTKADILQVQIPDTDSEKTTIPAKGRVIIWADGQPQQGVLHVSFKLGKEGESVILSKWKSDTEIVIVDEVNFPALDDNMSYSRHPDGSAVWVIQEPTFNLPNDHYTVSLNEIAAGLRVYPTAVKEFVVIENAMNEPVKITDISGKVISDFVCSSDKETMSLGHLYKGIYIIRVRNKPVRIVKQ